MNYEWITSVVIATIATLWGAYIALRDQQRADRSRVRMAARHAVRATEACFVRPKLRQRMADCILGQNTPTTSNLQDTAWRMRFFCALQRDVTLTPEEKTEAQVRAFNILVDLLRDMKPAPYIRVSTDLQLHSDGFRIIIMASVPTQQNTERLKRLLETEYGMRARPTQTLIHDLSRFAGICPVPQDTPPAVQSTQD
jgi:hypothetical protein